MDKQRIIEIIRHARSELESCYACYPVERVGLFRFLSGRPTRDIDLFESLDLKEFLQVNLHHKIDRVMESALKPAIGKRILAEVQYF